MKRWQISFSLLILLGVIAGYPDSSIAQSFGHSSLPMPQRNVQPDNTDNNRQSNSFWSIFDIFKPKTVTRPAPQIKKRVIIKQRQFKPKSKPQKTKKIRASVKKSEPRQFTLAKNAGAASVVVVGDSTAGEIQSALSGIYANNKDVRIINYAEPNTGLNRNGMIDLKRQLHRAVNSIPYVNLIVIMSGFNDRTGIPQGYEMLEFSSVEWQAVYTQRLINFMEYANSLKIPVIIASLPPSYSKELSDQVYYINELQQQVANEFKRIKYMSVGNKFKKIKYPYPGVKTLNKIKSDEYKRIKNSARTIIAKMLASLIDKKLKKVNNYASAYYKHENLFRLDFTTTNMLLTNGGNDGETTLIGKSQQIASNNTFNNSTPNAMLVLKYGDYSKPEDIAIIDMPKKLNTHDDIQANIQDDTHDDMQGEKANVINDASFSLRSEPYDDTTARAIKETE